jgi:hypothetical protein
MMMIRNNINKLKGLLYKPTLTSCIICNSVKYRTMLTLCNNIFQSKTMVCKPMLLNTILIRSMQSSRRFLGRQATNIVNRHCDSRLSLIFFPKRSATFVVKNPDPTNTDLQAIANNPFVGHKKKFQHLEVTRQTCDLPNCKDKTCFQLCSQLQTDTSIAHGTHGKPSLVTNVVVQPPTTTDLSGSSKQQNFVVYVNPHDVSKVQQQSPNVQPATTILQNDPSMLPEIKKYAK